MHKPVTPAGKSCPIAASPKKTLWFLAFALMCCATRVQAQCPPDLTVNGPGTGTWTAPASGGPWLVRITATGAGGGEVTGLPGGNPGSGAVMEGEYTIPNNYVLFAIAGATGGSGDNIAAGGGGGSGAVNCGNPSNCAGGTILVIAAGGNGQDGPFNGEGGSAQTGGTGQGGAGGGSDNGGGGGGLNSGGVNGTNFGVNPFSSGSGGGQVFKTGLSSGGTGSGFFDVPAVPNGGGNGMGGGGGGGDEGPGGGGGHTGGAGANAAAASSFSSGANQNNSDGATGGTPNAGQVVIACLGALPVELVEFKAVIMAEGVKLLWHTESEKDNAGYDVERSIDGRNWSPLTFVPGQGTTTEPSDYAFMDENPLPGVNYYRLKQMDTDGAFAFSQLVVADVRTDGPVFDIYPNPSVDGTLSIRTVNKKEGNILIEIFDWVGFKVFKETAYLPEGTVIYPVSLTNYPKGAYTVRMELPDGQVQFKKILLQ